MILFVSRLLLLFLLCAAMSNVVVVPRVIPQFLYELATVPHSVQVDHLSAFRSNISKVFRAKVEDEDVMDLLVALFSIFHSPDAFPPPPPLQDDQGRELSPKKEISIPGNTTSFLSLQILLEMFTLSSQHSPQCLRALKRLIDHIEKQKEEEEREVRPVNDTIDNVSPVRTTEDSQTTVIVTSHDVEEVGKLLAMDPLLRFDYCRASVLQLWEIWDKAGIDVSHFTASPETQHIYIPIRQTSKLKVYRDFVTCTQRPKLTREWGPVSVVHIKTNIKAMSEVMYRFLVEGYNYGVNAVIHSDVVGYTNRRWEELGNMTKYGWPEGWDQEMTNDYAPGCAISQYFSSDKFLVIKLRAKSMFCVGFSVSAWLVFHGMGNGYPVCATIHHQDDDL